MRSEVKRTNTLRVFTGGDSGLFGYATNILFRAVHDFQHIITGGTFGFRGEVYTAIPLLQSVEKWVEENHYHYSYTDQMQDILFSEMVAQSAYYTVTKNYLDVQKVVLGVWNSELIALGVK